MNYKKERIWVPCVPHMLLLRESKPCICDAPHYWAYIDFGAIPGKVEYKGFMLVKVDEGDMLNMDELEVLDLEVHQDIVRMWGGIE